MSLIDQELSLFLPPKRKQTPSGWISFNAVCCHHRGESPDDRKRGGVLMNPAGGFQYHCFNCGFKAGWTKGKLLSNNTKQLFRWMNMPDDKINELVLAAMREKEDIPILRKEIDLTLVEKPLPDDCMSIGDWVREGCQDPDLVNVISYILGRGMKYEWYNWHWSAAPGWRDRVIVPFYNDGKIVGYTGRKIKEGKPKYLTEGQGTYVFNIDAQRDDRKYVLVLEGQFDAIAVDGVAVMSNELNEAQIMRLRMLGKEIIIVPDHDKPGAKLIQTALDNDWSISVPDWGVDENGVPVKDAAKAVELYGRVYTLLTILENRETNKIKIELEKKKLERLDG